jgi:hypothetical protein
MSQLEDAIQAQLEYNKVPFTPQERIPVESWPWKRPRSHSPKCDFYLPTGNIYVEVKGFMTIHAMAKLSWFCRQNHIRYYIFQGTEEDWNPFIDSPVGNVRGTLPESNQKIREQNITHQIKELIWLVSNDPCRASSLSLTRLKHYIGTRISEYTEWNNEWY